MNKSESITKLAEALAKAQGQLQNAPKDSVNPFYKSKYADLATVIDTVRKAFSENGLSVTQLANEKDGSAEIETVLLLSHHVPDELWPEKRAETREDRALRFHDPQGFGSALTYASRYALSAIAGIASEADDDGNSASEEHAQPTKDSKTPKQSASGKIYDKAIGVIDAALFVEDLTKVRETAKVRLADKDLTQADYDLIIKEAQKKEESLIAKQMEKK